MNTTAIVGIGLALGVGYLLLRGSSASPTRTVTVQSPNGPISVQVPNVSASQAQSAIAQGRESAIQRLMTYSHLTRAQAEARYNQLVPSVTAALTAGAVSGIGNYCASA